MPTMEPSENRHGCNTFKISLMLQPLAGNRTGGAVELLGRILIYPRTGLAMDESIVRPYSMPDREDRD